MLSLGILACAVVLAYVPTAWVLTLAARAVGSPRARYFVALRCLLAIALLNIAIGVAGSRAAPSEPTARVAIALVLLAAQLLVAFVLIRGSFRLSAGRAFAPFGAYVLMIVLLLVFVLGWLQPRAIRGVVVLSPSMSPTMPQDARLIANKLLHPRRWDIVAYWCEVNHDRSIYCKRLVGLPGERLRFQNGQVYINDQLTPAPAVIAGKCHAPTIRCDADTLHQGEERYQDGQTITLGPDEYFFLGDNLEISLDSRSVGPSKQSSIVGVADVIYWPLTRLHVLR